MNVQDIPETWDLIVIGGGITGAGIFREAVRMGFSVLLLEQKDYSWGTSSRSTKLVHGGLRYLREGHLLLTKAAVEERERMLKEAPGLVEQVGFLLPVYKGAGPGKWTVDIGLLLYDLMAGQKQHSFLDLEEFRKMSPHLRQEDLVGGFRFFDAQVDDCRLVLRLIIEAVANGGVALNYTKATEILYDAKGNVAGVVAEDTETRETREFQTKTVINATGAWGEKLHPSPDPKRHLRPLRGSHMVFPLWALPLDHAVAFMHPADDRGFFAIPWEGAVLVGTTDIDHHQDLSEEPVITKEEVDYMMEGIRYYFPSIELSPADCLSTFAGVRPVLSEGKLSPSEESRDYAVWKKQGMVTVTGGKLTTFRRMAWDTLKAAAAFLPEMKEISKKDPVFAKVPEKVTRSQGLTKKTWRRLYGRYGESAKEVVASAAADDLNAIPGTDTLWAEIPFTANREQVRHLSDLLLRRVRIGLLTTQGGREHMERIRRLCSPLLPWSDLRWEDEIDMYHGLWDRAYSLPST
ncbi:MAG: glycerol-3-phosphate dehydrogenase/oxidase [Deltaproteobacteria bacterium]|nr:glycerol-3-phosphate dehydrogenase/oxidase [Deltaproteobacteria bacterium]